MCNTFLPSALVWMLEVEPGRKPGTSKGGAITLSSPLTALTRQP